MPARTAQPTPPLIAEYRDWLVCHDCGVAQKVVPVARDLQLVCCNCGHPLYFGRGSWLDKTTAMAVSALVLFIAAHVFDL